MIDLYRGFCKINKTTQTKAIMAKKDISTSPLIFLLTDFIIFDSACEEDSIVRDKQTCFCHGVKCFIIQNPFFPTSFWIQYLANNMQKCLRSVPS